MAFLRALFTPTKILRDPDQFEFTKLLINAAANREPGIVGLVEFLIKAPWSPSETRTRIKLALSMIKADASPTLYAKAKDIGDDLYSRSYQLG